MQVEWLHPCLRHNNLARTAKYLGSGLCIINCHQNYNLHSQYCYRRASLAENLLKFQSPLSCIHLHYFVGICEEYSSFTKTFDLKTFPSFNY